MQAIEVSNLVKEYKNGVKAIDGLNLNVKNGEIYGLLGPNGAGKSSLIKILTTYTSLTSGRVSVLGKDLCLNPDFVRKNISCVSQQVSIDPHLSLIENMVFQSRLYRVDNAEAKKRIDALVKSFGLEKYVKYPTASYSGGIKRRLDIAMNMVSMPKILFLDEPTVGMDIESRIEMWKTIQKIKNEFGTTIFLTTHYLEEADELCDTICIMKDGHNIISGTPESLKMYIRQNILKIGFDSKDKAKLCMDALSKHVPRKSFKIRGTSILTKNEDDRKYFTSINKWLIENEFEYTSIEIVKPSLEDVFLSIMKGDN